MCQEFGGKNAHAGDEEVGRNQGLEERDWTLKEDKMAACPLPFTSSGPGSGSDSFPR